MNDDEMVARIKEVFETGDMEAYGKELQAITADDMVQEYPQSGERFVGIDNIRAVYERYPGGLGKQDLASLRVTDRDRPWAMAPNFTLVRVSGSGDSYTSAVKARYPDGSDWYVISMIELVEGRMAHGTIFFAPVFDAPEWRKPFTAARAAGATEAGR